MAQARGRRGRSSRETCESKWSKGPKVQVMETKPTFGHEPDEWGMQEYMRRAGSRMKREFHVRFYRGLGVKLPRSTD